MNKQSILVSVITLALLSGCAHTKIEKDKISSIRKVAIIGFDVQQQKAVGMGDLLAIATKSKEASKAQLAIGEEAKHVIDIYNDLRSQIEKDTSWQVLPLNQIQTNPVYVALYKEKTEGFQMRPQINDRMTLLQAPQILDTFAARLTKEESLQGLQKALGVDALIIAGVQVQLYKGGIIYTIKSMFGKAELEPQAVTNLTLLEPRSNTSIWSESNALGEPAKSNEKTFLGLAQDEVVNRLSVQAARNSFDTLLKQYKETLVK